MDWVKLENGKICTSFHQQNPLSTCLLSYAWNCNLVVDAYAKHGLDQFVKVLRPSAWLYSLFGDSPPLQEIWCQLCDTMTQVIICHVRCSPVQHDHCYGARLVKQKLHYNNRGSEASQLVLYQECDTLQLWKLNLYSSSVFYTYIASVYQFIKILKRK